METLNDAIKELVLDTLELDKTIEEYLKKLDKENEDKTTFFPTNDMLKDLYKQLHKKIKRLTTKTRGPNLDKVKRNEKIKKEYYRYKIKGRSKTECLNLLSAKYKLATSSINSIIK